MKILLTGGAGYIGSHVLLSILEKNYKTVVVDDLSTGGVYLSYSGGYIDDIKDVIEDYKEKIISGEIVPPSVRP